MSYNYGISKFDITNRINEKIRQFSATIVGKPDVSTICSGNKFQMLLSDLYGASSPGIFNGRIERMQKARTPTATSFTVVGRDNSVFLVKQPINFPCYQVSTSKFRERTLIEILTRILKGTGLTYGSEWEELGQTFHNDKGEQNWFCGEFKTKQNAINVLLQRYLALNDLDEDAYRWYVDVYGVVRVFNIYADNRPSLTFNQHRKEMTQLEFEDNAEQVENDITFVGGANSDITERLYNEDSIERFGRRVGGPVQNTNLLLPSKVISYGKSYLKRVSYPIYTGTLTMAGYPQAEVGLGIKFPFDEDFGELDFTITSVIHSGTPGDYLTKIDFSTDEQVVVNPSWTDLIMSIINSTAATDQPIIAEVQSIDLTTGDVQFKPVGTVSSDILDKTITVSTSSDNLVAKKI